MTPLQQARALDAADPLRDMRDRFDLPDGVIYLDGNSLGPLPAATAGRLGETVVDAWGRGLIGSWNAAGWFDLPVTLGGRIARLLGVPDDEAILAESTSVALFRLLVGAARSRPGRRAIVAEAGNFPTDAHVAQGVAELLGLELRLAAPDALEAAFAPDVAAAVLAHVHYRSGVRHDMAALQRRADAAGVPLVWDLSHSIGAVPLDLARDGATLAVGCGYKYLNGGPGAPAFLHVARRLWGEVRSPLTGWTGHAEPFAFQDRHEPAPGLRGFLAGTPPVLGATALGVGVDLMLEVDMDQLWTKSQQLWTIFVDNVVAIAPELELVTPRDPARRGSHASFRHPQAFPIVQALIARGVIGDYREPGIARFGLTPLTLSHEDAWTAAQTVGEVMRTEAWKDPAYAVRGTVT